MASNQVTKDAKGDVITPAVQMHGFSGDSGAADQPLLVDGARDLLPPGHDDFYIGAEERKMYNIPEHMEPAWIRDDRAWKNRVPGNRESSFQRENPGGYVVKVDGAPVVCGDDLVLAVRPRGQMDKYRETEAKDAYDFQKRMLASMESEVMEEDDFDKSNEDRKRQMKAAATRRHMENGMIGQNSPSQGMNLDDYIRFRGLSADDIATEELTYARGRSSVSIDDLKQIQAEMEGGRRSTSGSGKTYSLPANVRPRNLAKS